MVETREQIRARVIAMPEVSIEQYILNISGPVDDPEFNREEEEEED